MSEAALADQLAAALNSLLEGIQRSNPHAGIRSSALERWKEHRGESWREIIKRENEKWREKLDGLHG